MQVRGWVPFASTFAAFLSRAYDFVRMAAISRADIRLSGSHAGVSIGEDGPSQMALEDIAAFRAVHGSTVLHPSDANQTAKLVAAMADQPGISFMRTLRGKTEIRTAPDEDVRIGGSRVVRDGDDVAIVACGITVDQAVEAAEQLAADGIEARVIDAYSIKPIDAEAVRAAARDCGGVVTVEDHWPEGGLGDAVLEALAEADERPPVHKLAVREMPTSGSPDELLHAAGIDAPAIAEAARSLTRERASARVAPAGGSSTGAKQSPCSATRASTSSEVKLSSSGSRLRSTASTSSQVTRGRDRRPLARPQRVHAHRRLERRVLAPVDEHLARAQVLAHLRHDQLRVAALQDLRDALRERPRPGERGRRVERHVDLHPLRPGGLGERDEPEVVERVAQPARHLGALHDRGRRAGIQVEGDHRRLLGRGRAAERRVQLQIGQVGEPDERGEVVAHAVGDVAAVGVGDRRRPWPPRAGGGSGTASRRSAGP